MCVCMVLSACTNEENKRTEETTASKETVAIITGSTEVMPEEVKENTPEAAALRFEKIVWDFYETEAETVANCRAYLEDVVTNMASENNSEVIEFLNNSILQWKSENEKEYDWYTPASNVAQVNTIDEFIDVATELTVDILYQQMVAGGFDFKGMDLDEYAEEMQACYKVVEVSDVSLDLLDELQRTSANGYNPRYLRMLIIIK